ncbi:AraC family transcriptional regulator [Rubellicoccus peritrichatus]|uniref:AraC family transcriptional regulator n=1 Tax=Rubellicoccus peritrichatus TaxID=3080537 RepID=A0AAQ3LET6_9BACT|nr:AraC family transcriptional regulator [Puniceicoccus sp. CR14]WOO40609.1 AraC family transcriptional regulator [Puniceicoccus sp. CR14]
MKIEQRIAEGFPQQRLVVVPTMSVQRCKELPLVNQLYITHIGSYPSAPGHYVKRDGSKEVIMIYCINGSGSIEIDNFQHKMRKGHAALIPHNTPHIYRSSRKDPWSIFWIHFAGSQKALAIESLGLSRAKPLLFVPDSAKVRNAFEDIYACLKYQYSDAGLLATTSELMRLLSILKLHYGAPQKQENEDRILSTIGFMQQHVHLQLTLEELATQAALSIPHYSKLFRRCTSKSPMAYFSQLKIRKACELLQQTEEPVQHIALQLGYDDPFYFSRLFKKLQGVSPSEYRNQLFQ